MEWMIHMSGSCSPGTPTSVVCVFVCYLVICFIMESVPFPSVVVVVWVSQATHKLNAQHYIFTPVDSSRSINHAHTTSGRQIRRLSNLYRALS